MDLLLSALLLIWGLLWIQARAALRRIPTLVPPMIVDGKSAFVSVVIPARNEERSVENTIRSLMKQKGVSLEVIVVNDHSEDKTGKILEALCHEYSNLQVVHNPILKEGWMGKTNALSVGAELAKGEVLLFTDADIHFRPLAVYSALKNMEQRQLDFLSLFPRFRWKSLFEHCVMPGFFLGLLHAGSSKIEDPKAPNSAVAVGAFLMIRRDSYVNSEGHSSIKSSLIDDLELAISLKKSGARVGVGLAPDLIDVRMYYGNIETMGAFDKNVLGPLGAYWWLGFLLPMVFGVLYGSGCVGLCLGAFYGKWSWMLLGGGLFLVQYCSFWTLKSWHDFSGILLVFYPLAVFLIGWSVAIALWRRIVRGTTKWRGREISLR